MPNFTINEINQLFSINFNEINWSEYCIDRPNKIKLLIAEDERSFREMLEEIFENNGYYTVLSVPDGKKGWEKFQDFNPKIIITDIMMDYLTGVEMADKIRKVKPNQKILFMSGWVSINQISEKFPTEFDTGNFKFIEKPFDIEKFQNIVYLFENNHLVDITINILSTNDLNKTLRLLSPYEIYTFHNKLWDLCEYSFDKLLNKPFKREDLTTLLTPIAEYQKKVNCLKEPEECRIFNCLNTNPACANKKLRGQIKVIQKVLNEIYDFYIHENFPNKLKPLI